MKARQTVLWAVILLGTTSQAYDFAGGTGEPNAPYRIATAEQLCSIGSDPNLLDKHFVLVSDIDLDPNLPEGQIFKDALIAPQSNRRMLNDAPFSGQFNGQNHVIRHVIINGNGVTPGLFGWTSETALIQNLQLDVIEINQSYYARSIGGLVGNNQGTIEHCICREVNISGSSRGIGGLAGYNTGTISQCSVQGNVTGGSEVGGLVGYNDGQISQCNGRVKVTCDSSWMGGGLVGYNHDGTVSTSYCIGEVLGKTDASGSSYGIGGLIGYGYYSDRVSQCYTVTKVAGTNSQEFLTGPEGLPQVITDSFWNTETRGIPNSDGGVGLSTVALQNINTYLDAGWDISAANSNDCNTVWCISDNHGYPTLAWETEISDLRYAPDLRGLSLEEAESVLRGFGLTLGQVEKMHDPRLPEGFVISSLPVGSISQGHRINVMASGGPYDWSTNAGNGTDTNPYQIETPGQLLSLQNHEDLYDNHFILTQDLDFSGYLFTRTLIAGDQDNPQVFNETPFTGVFDGNRHTIKHLSFETQKNSSDLGLFGKIGQTGIVKYLGLENVQVSVKHKIDYASTPASRNEGTLLQCYASLNLSTRQISYDSGAGLVSQNDGLIDQCYITGTLPDTPNQTAFVHTNSGIIRQCYSSVSLRSSITTSGNPLLVMRNYGQVFQSYHQIAAHSTINGIGTPLTSELMKDQSSYLNWDFYDPAQENSQGTWFMQTNSYPSFVWEFENLGLQAIPSIINMPLHRAQTLLTDHGFLLGEVSYDFDPTIPQGHIMIQPPTFVPEHSTVDLWVSQGPYRWENNPGDGTPNNPCQITLASQLYDLTEAPELYDRHFILMNDIDCHGKILEKALIAPSRNESYVWDASDVAFSGTFDGNGHTIRNLVFQPPFGTPMTYLGLFGRIDETGVVKDLSIEEIEIIATVYPYYMGLLAGESLGTVKRCRVSGQETSGLALRYGGGLIGNNQGMVSACSADIHMSFGLSLENIALKNPEYPQPRRGGRGGPQAEWVGGLIGNNTGTIQNCYNTGTMTYPSSWTSTIGGLVGQNSGAISNSYTRSAMAISPPVTGQALIGINQGPVLDCYFLHSDDGGGVDNGEGTPLNLADMANIDNFDAWDFVERTHDGNLDIWTLPDQAVSPLLTFTKDDHEEYDYAGQGTDKNPYLIQTAEDLKALNLQPNAYFQLTHDLDLKDSEWTIPAAIMFTGHMDGNSHKISNFHLTSQGHSGFFGLIAQDAVVENLTISGTLTSNREGINGQGLLAGINRGLIRNCHAVNGSFSGQLHTAGGLVGINHGSIMECHANITIALTDNSMNTGGLAGKNQGTITRCYTNGSIVSGSSVGGLVGYNRGSIGHSYSTTSVTGQNNVGGLIGLSGDSSDSSSRNLAKRCFSTGEVTGARHAGGMIGKYYYYFRYITDFRECLWNTDTSTITYNTPCIGLNTEELTQAETYALNGWAGDPNWIMNDGQDFPHLAWEGTPGQMIPEINMDWMEGNGTTLDPYQISTPEQLVKLSTSSNLWNSHFILVADLDLAGHYIQPIGSSQGFDGSFNGNGHILYNVTMDASQVEVRDFGLFGVINGHVLNLGIDNAQITCALNSQNVGILAGQCTGSIAGCSVTGTLIDQGSGNTTKLGGLTGYLNNGAIANCYTDCHIVNTQDTDHVAGLVGFSSGRITHCLSTGLIDLLADWYSVPLVNSDYSGTVCHSFWREHSNSPEASSILGTGLSDLALADKQLFLAAGWDFVSESKNGTADIWTMNENQEQPKLSIFSGHFERPALHGSGTPETPYQIASPNDLGAINYYPLGACFQLVTPLDLSETTWSIAPVPYFQGIFDGNGLSISNLTITGIHNLGLFGSIGDQATVIDLDVNNVSITGFPGSQNLGGLAGSNQGHINSCKVTGTLSATDTDYLGGMIGSQGGGRIVDSYASVNINAEHSLVIGGLVGYASSSPKVDINRCYATGQVTANSSYYPAGLIGRNGQEAISGSAFWDIETSGLIDSQGGTGLTTTEMQTALPFLNAGWDFEFVWTICEGKDYPRLQWEETVCD